MRRVRAALRSPNVTAAAVRDAIHAATGTDWGFTGYDAFVTIQRKSGGTTSSAERTVAAHSAQVP